VVAFDRAGRRLAYGRHCHSTIRDASGRSEQNPASWWSSLKNALRIAEIGKSAQHVVGYAVSTLRAAVLACDDRGRPLAPAILASDTRAAEEVQFLSKKVGDESLYAATGLKLNTYSSLPRILWLKKRKPEFFRRTSKIVCAQDYIISKLTGRLVTDHSHASRTLCLDLQTKQWRCDMLESLNLSCKLFPTLVDPGTVVGELSSTVSRALGIPRAPVIAAGGDQMCASVGLGGINPEDVTINHGTGSFVERPTPEPVLDLERRSLTSVHVLEANWIQEFPILLTGRLLEDLLRITFNSSEDFAETLESALASAPKPPSNTSLLFLPYQSGSTAPHWTDSLQGVVWGFNCNHRPADLLRALLQAIIFDLRRCLHAVALQPKKIFVGGRLANLPAFNQLQADIFGIPVSRRLETEVTALGAAIVGFVALDYFTSAQDAVRAMVHSGKHLQRLPNMHMKPHYEDLFQKQSELLSLAIMRSKG
jgi:sugar (pentulose or hexulose) kinase